MSPINHATARRALAYMSCASLFAVAMASATPLAAQSQAEPPETPKPAAAEATAPAPQAAQDIIVTGSRITSTGFSAPTPTQVIGEQQIANNAQPNLFTTVAQLPSLQGSTGTTVNTFSTSSGQQGLSSFSLRGLGPIRTLTLLDGQRVVGANVTGVPDISLFPQLLVKRVDVVNGGASSSYGSDAVGGVVNFITDTHFEGIKGNIQGSITTYGDDKTGLAQFAVGKSFFDKRLHVVASAEYMHEDGVGPGEYGLDLAGGRDWYRQSTIVNRNVLNDGAPQYLFVDYAQNYQYAKYGLITAGPLQGTAFDASGNPYPFQYGNNGVGGPQGVPSRNASGSVTGCYPGFCIGGDLSGLVDAGRSLQSSLKRAVGYGRIGYEFADNNEFYITTNLAQVKSQNQPINGMNRTALTIQCANPYVPDLVKSACATNNITSFQFGTANAILPSTQVHTDRRQYRYVAGAKGTVPVFGKDLKYDLYYEHGIERTTIDVDQILLSQRFTQAINATTLNGAIVCADAVARANGCVPINVFGGTSPSDAALGYIMPKKGPYQHTRQTQDVISLNFSGSPVELWAGPLSIAFGGEWRREYYKVRADAYGNGIDTQAGVTGTPFDADYPADPALLTTGNNWYAGNYKNGQGKYTVKEGFFEVDLPLMNSGTLGRANLNAAARVTDYSTSGTVWTWKVGGTWDTPLKGLRLRAQTSRDIRAPNLSELFAAPVTTTLPTFFDPFRNTNIQVIQNQVGNPALRPERARNTTVGLVFAGSPLLPGFSASVDYYHLKIKDVVSSLGAGDIVNFCFTGELPETCSAFNLNNQNGPNFVNVQAFNLASILTEGFDFEVGYRWNEPLGLKGNLVFRGLATHIRKYVTDNGLPNQIPFDTAGQNLGATPYWKWLASQTYQTDQFSIMIQERGFSDGILNGGYVVCQSNCPASTVSQPTYNTNSIPGRFYLDLGGSYNVTSNITAYFKVDNVTNKDPARSPFFVNPMLYDVLGRVYRGGVRFKF